MKSALVAAHIADFGDFKQQRQQETEMSTPEEFSALKCRIKDKFREAVQQLTARCLQKAATWTSEHVLGMDDNGADDQAGEADQMSANPYSGIALKHVDALMMARCLLSGGEYQRCAFFLRSRQIGGLTSQHEGEQKAARISLFLSSYARYLAGEKLKEQLSTQGGADEKTEAVNADGTPAVTSPKPHKNKTVPATETERRYASTNSNLQSLYDDLYGHYAAGHMHQDGFLLYIFAVVARDLRRQEGLPVSAVLHNIAQNEHSMDCSGGNIAQEGVVSARQLFLESLHAYPWNWSCWLEFAELCVSDKQALPTWQDISHGVTADADSSNINSEWECAKVMYACFLIHAYLEKHCGDLAMQVIESTVLPILPNSLVLHAQTGLARYTLRQYDAAEAAFVGVRAADPYRLPGMDTYSNILYVKEKRAELSRLAHAIVQVEKFCPESCCVVGNYYSLKGQHERAVTYFQRAIRLNSSYLSAWTLMGHEYMELRNTAAAVQCYRNAVDISEVDYRAWYGLGQTYEMLHLYQYAHFYYRKAAYLRPFDARMWGAVGNCMLKLGLKEQAIASFERAVGCGDLEGIATRDLARLCREEGQAARAAEFYLKFLQISRFFDTLTQDQDQQGDGSADMYAARSTEDQARAHYSGKHPASADTSVSSNAALLGALLQGVQTGGAGASGALRDAVDGVSESGLGGLGAGPGLGAGARMVADGEQAEALLFLAVYYRSTGNLDLAQVFCGRLQGFMGPEGEEARVLMRAITSTIQQQRQHQQQAQGQQQGATNSAVNPGNSRSVLLSPGGGMNDTDTSALNTSARSLRSHHSQGSRRQSGFLVFGSSNPNLTVGSLSATPLHSRRGGAGPGTSDTSAGGDGMTSSQSLQMDYTSLSLSPNT